MMDEERQLLEETDITVLETLDHVLDRGLVIAGEVTISVADIDLIFLGLNLLVGSVETIEQVLEKWQPAGTKATADEHR
ncbi:MAG TPA: gas vesicle protein [Blastocatellia bacterium]|nr:gas vesicle protein [Blastocatellia bacterium]